MTILKVAPFAALLLLGCNKSSSPAPTTSQQSVKAVPSSVNGHPKIVGKWHWNYTSRLGQVSVDNLEFFESGDFSVSTLKQSSFNGGRPQSSTGAGTYKFIDSSHLKLDTGFGGEIYQCSLDFG